MILVPGSQPECGTEIAVPVYQDGSLHVKWYRQHKVAGEFYRNIVTILRQQGYAIVAEGVEEQEEVELLEAWGVDMIQGYYFSRPLPVEEFLKKIREAG